MKVKDLLKILVAEDLTFYLKLENGNEIELEIINGSDYDNLIHQHYFVNVDYETFEDDETGEYNLKPKHIIGFDLFNECEVVKLCTDRNCTKLTFKL